MKNRQAETYNALYNLVRGKMSSRDIGFYLNTFYDGSASIVITVARKNAVINLSMLIVPEFDDNDHIIRWRITEEDACTYADDIRGVNSRLTSLIQQTRTMLAKI